MLTRSIRAGRGGLLAAIALTLLTSTPAVAATGASARVGSLPILPAGATLVATDATIHSVQVTVALKPRDPAALSAYAAGVSEPSASIYRHFLTTAQFRRRFAPSAATIARVERSLRAHGLKPGHVDASGLSIDVTASSGQLEHAFKLSLASVRLRSGRDAFYNRQAPAFDAQIASSVQAVIGLSTLYPMHDMLERESNRTERSTRKRTAHSALPQVATGGPQPCGRAQSDSAGSGGYTADQIASYYNYAPLYEAGDKGQGVTVALYELESDLPADIAGYQSCYGTHTKITYVKVDGGSGSGSGSGEAALDIEQIVGLAPKVHVLVYQGPNSNNGSGPFKVYQTIADQDKASVISTSWGDCEPEETRSQANAENTIFEQMAVQGQTLVAAAGDSGSEDCWIGGAGGNSDNSLEVDDPASQPFVTGAGGTSLELGSAFNLGGQPGNTTYPTANPNETVWNNSYPGIQYQGTYGVAPGAGGGGVSAFWQMPAYQSDTVAVAPWLNVVNAASSGSNCLAAAGSYCRELPDVSGDADPMDGYMIYWNGGGQAGANTIAGWQSIGGTSAVAPLWASLFALSEASATCDGNLIGFANPALYSLASSSQAAYASYFNDISSDAINQAGDDNDLSASGNTSNQYAAGVGYDMASGLGTPNAANLAPALCKQAVQVNAHGMKQSFVGTSVRLHLSASLPAGQSGAVTYSARNLPAGLHLNHTTGLVTGRIAKPGVYNTVFGASSASGDVGGHSYVWTVAGRPAASALSLEHTATGSPRLAFTVTAGKDESALRAVTVRLPAGVSLQRPLRGIHVVGAAGRPVPHRLTIVSGNLVISFKPAHSPDRISFAGGALRARGALLKGSVPRVKLMLRVVDALGASTSHTYTIRALA